jgi:uncharacterized protein (DUF1015 family)
LASIKGGDVNIVKPFNGIIYNKNKVGDIGNVLTPPYDIIDSAMQDTLYNKHPYNFIRIDFGKKFETDNENDNVYLRAKKYFETWLEENILIKDEQPSFYLLIQKFSLNNSDKGKILKRIGFFGIYKLTEYSKDTIMPHEKTQSAPKEDRYLLTKTCKAYFSGVFSLYADETYYIEKLAENIVNTTKPEFSFIDYQNVENEFYKIDDEEICKNIIEFMKYKPLYIADGHHRYETALRISKEFKHLNNEAVNYTIMYFTNMLSPGIKILPTHRILHNTDYDFIKLKDFLKQFFDLKEFPLSYISNTLAELEKMRHKHAFIIVTQTHLLLAFLKDLSKVESFFPTNLHISLKKLDVNILYYVILKGFFNIQEEDLKLQKNITYEKDVNAVINIINSEKSKIGFLLNATTVDEIKDVVTIGETMPQKSTYFYPKIPSGVVIYSFDGKNF